MQKWGVVLPLVLTGCTAIQQPVDSGYDIAIYPKFVPSSQALVPLNDLQAIATLDIIPFIRGTGETYTPISAITGNSTTLEAADVLKLSQASPTIDPNRPFILRKLKPNQRYRVYAKAYNVGNALISQDSNSYVEFDVANNDSPQMASLPVKLLNVPFGATAAVVINTEGRYDYLKSTLYLVSGNSQVAVAQTVRNYPTLQFTNLQGNTNYRLLLEAHKLGTLMASTSQDLAIGSENAPATFSVTLRIPYVTTTLAGNGIAGYVDAMGTSAKMSGPIWALPDNKGNLYIADYQGHRIRKITADGMVGTFAGDGTAGVVNGPALNARFNQPTGLAMDPQGNLYVADFSGQCIRKITPEGIVSTFVGSTQAGFLDGSGTSAQFYGPETVTADSLGNLYVGDRYNHRVRKITSGGVVSTLAGNGTVGYLDAQGVNARLSSPIGTAIDSKGNIYVAELGNNRIRKIDSSGNVTTIAGSGSAGYVDGTGTQAAFKIPTAIAIDPYDNLYVVESGNALIRRISPEKVVTTIAGNGIQGFSDGTGTAATLNTPFGISIDAHGCLYIGEENGHRVKRLQ